MDEMRIESKLMRCIAGKWIRRQIKKKFGYDVKIDLSEFKTTVIDGTAHVHINIDAELDKTELDKLVSKIG